MAPRLFVFLMQAVMKSLHLRWNTIMIPTWIFRFRSRISLHADCKVGERSTRAVSSSTDPTRLDRSERPLLSFLLDRFLLTKSHTDLVAGATDLHAHFARFGLLIFTVQLRPMLLFRNRKSKIENMYFPASPNTIFSHSAHPDPFQISTLQHMDFTHEFCYLGSIFTTDLR
jgi:hypothetical protein